ncbi:putative ribosome biogenesis protein slx9-like isoform X4 [Gossypium hirsutum]|uniref:Ribosome biogenesis protein slx9-like isoform X4 n=1 Tax=Gossypium hirsutum TaxID=3635 RepID=A0ABM2ZR54_GOSHI|nr:putative ribosome biogenesis protein slx9-like isoform X4 [Gossypium hirsutum]
MGKPSSRPDSSSKADKKFDKKVQFYAKVRDTVASLTAKKDITKKKFRSRQKKLKAYDLSALSEFLPELKAPRANDFKLNCKSRLKEGKQLSAVLEHPAFQADPLAAIHQHLQNTQPVLDEKPKKKKNQNGGRKKKSKKSKALSRQQSMDI